MEEPVKNEMFFSLLEKWFTYAIIWSFGATVNEEGRKFIDNNMRDVESMFPHSGNVYDYYINNDKNEWSSWEEKIGTHQWKPSA